MRMVAAKVDGYRIKEASVPTSVVGSRLVIAVTSGDSDPALLRARARRQLESRREQATVHTQTLFVTLKHRDAATVARVAETYAPHLLLWGGIACDTDRAALTALVDMLRCPVVLVA